MCSKCVRFEFARATEGFFERGGGCDHMIFVERTELMYSTCMDLKRRTAHWMDFLSTRELDVRQGILQTRVCDTQGAFG